MVYQPTKGMLNVGDLFVCDCGVPIAKCTAPGVFESLIRAGGNISTITSQAVGGIVKIKCKKCLRGVNHIHTQE